MRKPFYMPHGMCKGMYDARVTRSGHMTSCSANLSIIVLQQLTFATTFGREKSLDI